MNLFQKFGIKEVANVTFYSINKIGDKEINTPFLFLDTLKVSTIEKTAQSSFATGGQGNKKLIKWNFGKEITLNLEDALFSPASQSLMWGGNLNSEFSNYMSIILKANLANDYGDKKFSTKAYPSPALTEDEWELLFNIANITTDEAKQTFITNYFERNGENDSSTTNKKAAIPIALIDDVFEEINTLKKLGEITTNEQDLEVIDRYEKCIVKNRNGLTIDMLSQKENLFKYYSDDRTSSYVIYYDAKTGLPLVNINENGEIVGWTGTDTTFKLKVGTIYHKWSRTVQNRDNDSTIGNRLVIDSSTFPDNFKIVGETYIRNKKTNKDERYQFTIYNANVNSNSSLTLSADGEPTTFSMAIDVLVPKNGIQMEMVAYNVEEDLTNGGQRIVPQRKEYTHTKTWTDDRTTISIENDEIY